MICEEIKVQCTVQMRRFDTLISALNSNNGDAIIASIAQTPEMRARVDFSDPYYRTPARFVALRNSPIDDVRPEALEGKKIAVVAGTAHEAYLKDPVYRGRDAAVSQCGRGTFCFEAR
jgi:polar amino acid transport system substrate-binding protein